MGLELPDLDDREFEELVEDARKRIPVHSEEWTDHNAHDPGITFLELLAWVAETDVYRLDQLTDAHVEKYLQLVGVSPDPPTPATVQLSLDVPPKLDGQRVPAGEPLRAQVGPGVVEQFRTRRAVTLTTATVAAVVSQTSDGRTDNTTANDSVGMYYRAFGDDPSAGDALYVGFDTDPFATADRLDLTVDFHDANLPPRASHGDESSTFEPSHRVAWEFYERKPESDEPYAQWYEASRWTEFGSEGDVRDGTTQFYEGGTVSLPAPDGWLGEPGAVLGGDRSLHWIRGRLARREPPPTGRVCGEPERPTPPTPQYEVPPQFDAIRTNVVTAEHCATATDEQLERHDGPRTTARPDQTFHFDDAPVQSATVTVGGTRWQEVSDFAGSGPDDEHYVLDRATGSVRFGDGVQGEVPQADQEVVATDYVYGGGTAGNVPASTDWTFEQGVLGDVSVISRSAASGGTDAESLESALARAKGDQRTPYRAVTRSDYSYLATHTPGLRFGRAAVRPGTDGAEPVRVVVVPFSPPDVRPVPSEGFLEAVDCHLDRHALLSDDVTAVAPTYVGVAVDAEVRVADGSPRAARRRAAEDAIDEFLDPIRGFEGDGWPFGRPVYRSEIYEVLETTQGIETVLDVSVATPGATDLGTDGSALPYPERIDVRVADAPDTCRRDD